MSENVVDTNKTISIKCETCSVNFSISSCNNTAISHDSYEIILQQKQKQVKRSIKNESSCLYFFIFFYYVKYYVKKLRLCFLIIFLTVFFIISLLLFLVGVLNENYCSSQHYISLYLIIFGIFSILRIFLFISCPFSYEKYKSCLQCKFKLKCCVKARKEFKDVSSDFKNRKKKLGVKSKLPTRISSKPSVMLDNSAINFISRKFSDTTENRQIINKKSTDTLIRNHHHHHRPDEYRHLERYNTKYKFIDCNSIRYASAVLFQRTIDLFLLCWFIYGNYFVFSNSVKSTNNRVHDKNLFIFNSLIQIQEFCDNFSSYKVALVQIVSFYALFAFLIIFYALFSACKLIYGVLKKHYQANSDFSFV